MGEVEKVRVGLIVASWYGHVNELGLETGIVLLQPQESSNATIQQ